MRRLNSAAERRRIQLLDRSLEMGVFRRVLTYWLAANLFVCLVLAFGRVYEQSDTLFIQSLLAVAREHWTVFTASTLLLPFIIRDLIAYMHKFANPLYKLGDGLGKAVVRETVAPIRIREDDLWPDLVDNANLLIQELEELRAYKAAKEGGRRKDDAEAVQLAGVADETVAT